MYNSAFNQIQAETIIARAHNAIWDQKSTYIIPSIIMLEREYNNLKNLAFHPTWNIKEHIVNMLVTYPNFSNPDLSKAYHILAEAFADLSSEIVKEVILIITELPIAFYNNDDFNKLFFLVLSYKNHLRRAYEYSTPNEISQLITSIYPLNNSAKVYNPFARIATISNFLPTDANYTGIEQNSYSYALGVLNLTAQKKTGTCNLTLSDSILNWNDHIYDLIISNPPFGLKSSDVSLPSEYKDIEGYVLHKTLEQLGENGKAVFVFPLGFFYRESSRLLRKEIVTRDLLEYIIELPGGLFEPYTGIPSVVVCLNANPKLKGGVTFINAKNYITTENRIKKLDFIGLLNLINDDSFSEYKIWSKKDGIAYRDFALNADRYLGDYFTNHTYPLITLGEICSLTPKSDTPIPSHNMYYIGIRDLKQSPDRPEIDTIDLEYRPIPKNSYCVNQDTMLFAMKGNQLRPSYLTIGDYEDSIFISNDICAVQVTSDKIAISYLFIQLYSDFTQKQLNSFRNGSSIKTLSFEDLMKIKIELPSFDDQNSIIMKFMRDSIVPKERLKEELISKLKADTREDLKIKKHNLSQHLNEIKSSVSALIKFIAKSNGTISNEDLISIKRNISVKDHLTLSYDAIIRLGELLENLTNDESFGKDQIINIDHEINLLIKNYLQKDNFIFEYFYDEQTFRSDKTSDDEPDFYLPLAKINRNDLRELFNNIIENAITHGFREDGKNYIVDITVSYDLKNECINILFSNNGLALPIGMDEKRFFLKGEKGGKYGHTGLGGNRIKTISEHFNGTAKLFNEADSDFPVKINISLPLIINNNEIQTNLD